MKSPTRLLRKIRLYIMIVIIGLSLSGITAFPLQTELAFLSGHDAVFPVFLTRWLNTIYSAVKTTNQNYPYLSYGTDWLAFAHLIIAMVFIGPLKNPVKNIWVIQFGIVACILIIPLALIAGPIRHIPFFWRLLDCSFGLCIIPLWLCYRNIKKLEADKRVANAF